LRFFRRKVFGPSMGRTIDLMRRSRRIWIGPMVGCVNRLGGRRGKKLFDQLQSVNSAGLFSGRGPIIGCRRHCVQAWSVRPAMAAQSILRGRRQATRGSALPLARLPAGRPRAGTHSLPDGKACRRGPLIHVHALSGSAFPRAVRFGLGGGRTAGADQASQHGWYQ